MALPVSFRWDEDFIARIDQIRGDVPRSKYIQRAVESRLDADEQATATIHHINGDPTDNRPENLQPPIAQRHRRRRDVKPIPKKGSA